MFYLCPLTHPQKDPHEVAAQWDLIVKGRRISRHKKSRIPRVYASTDVFAYLRSRIFWVFNIWIHRVYRRAPALSMNRQNPIFCKEKATPGGD